MGCCCGKLEERINEMFEPNQIIAKETCLVNLKYHRSVGCCQVGGNGALVLTSEMLWFNLVCLDYQIEVPLRLILGVRVGRRRLIVDFVEPTSGIHDQVIFELRQPQIWKMLIEATKADYFGELERRVSQRFAESRIIRKEIFWANLQYQKSVGPHQVQGNGALVLTLDVLWFALLLPDKRIEMPLQNIRAVEVHNLRRRSTLLVVDLVDRDQVIFTSKDPQSWKRVIDEAIQAGQNRI